MSNVCEVVKVAREDAPGGFVEINKTDLTEDDVLYDAEPEDDKDGDKDLTVNEIKAALPDASGEELSEMLEAETGGKNRTTAIEAIEAEIEKRGAE